MTTEVGTPVEERIRQLLQHLGIRQAHFAGRAPGDWSDLSATYPELFVSLTLVCPPVPDPNAVRHLGSKLLVFTGDQGPYHKKVRHTVESLPGARIVTLRDFASWSDVAADHSDEIGSAIMQFLARTNRQETVAIDDLDEEYGEVAGISYHIRGSGPPLVLLPLGLVPSQWEPLVPRLSEDYCTITLGGSELGIVALLEERSGAADFLGMVRNLIAEAQLQHGESVLEVGCGTGILDRWLARHTQGNNPIIGVDINAYLLREAAAFAQKERLEETIEFREGNAEALPFPDNTFDVTLSVTVMEEVNAKQMLAEMVRVTKPGGRVAVAVRAIDRPLLINLPLRAELKAKVEDQSDWAPGVTERGCADASLYRLFLEAGLTEVKKIPQLTAFDSPVMLDWLQNVLLPTLNQEDVKEWRAARAQAEAEGTFFYSWPHHCAVGTKSF